MMHRFVCLLLVTLMLANQGLCFAHSHHGTDITVPENHASRPHFHLGGHEHHDDSSHGHDSNRTPTPREHGCECEPFIFPAVDHDANAVYCTTTVTLTHDVRSVTADSAAYFATYAILQVMHQNDDWLMRSDLLRGEPSSVFDTACPIYLRTLSMRI